VTTTERRVAGIGPVTFQRSRRARNLRITVQPLQPVRVVLPPGVSLEKGRDFLQSKRAWITRRLKIHEEILERHHALLSSMKPVDPDTARRRLNARLEALASRFGFSYNKCVVRNQKTCWGSCTPGNNISLNVHLACLPKKLADYVILHELVHTIVKSHGPAFWKALEDILPEARKRAGELKEYSLDLFFINREPVTSRKGESTAGTSSGNRRGSRP